MPSSDISGVILAGGYNRRFSGIVKANHMIGGERIIDRILNVIDGILNEIIIVTNTPEDFSRLEKYIITADIYKGMGPLGGIHAGMKASTKDALFVFAGDMPYISKSLVEEQLKYYSDNECDILVPKLGNYMEPLHGIYRNTLLDKLAFYLEEGQNLAVYEFIERMNGCFFHVDPGKFPVSVFTNINSQADADQYERMDNRAY
jgi:molybdopterin-guanine dinucleotide biosynthesis protein A